MKTAGMTHVGRIRKSNQDNFFVRNYDSYDVFGVADGMGGHNGGETASLMAVDALIGYFDSRKNADFFEDSAQISEFIKGLNLIIYHKSLTDMSLNGMGTTLTLCIANEAVAMVFHVGDSRAYLMHPGGKMYQITKDHSLVQYMIDTKQITPEQAKTHPNRNIITRAVGTESPLEVDVFVVSVSAGDKILLCSDGLSNMLDDAEIAHIIDTYEQEVAVSKLIESANAHGGTDNITAVLFEG
ncbi:MAG: Stp1/IreP family PP2C-type Ser/Thr phosphatase [Anaerofustis stercorihominis]|nr:Stp1/IreP family PP2C-type Ser/Thr phosphatase [Anaerofustis stercorihominis]